MRWTSSPLAGSVLAFAVAGVAVTFLRWDALSLPPTWDAVWSVFPGALTLEENGFDTWGLLRETGFVDGGPGTHALSPVTWMTALVAMVFDDPGSFLAATHIVHFLIGGVALVGLYRLAEPVLGRWSALGAVAVAALIPLVRAQLGFMYLEIPLLAATVWAVDSFVRGRLGLAAVLAALATWIKPSGVIVGVALAMALLIRWGWRNGWRWGLVLTLPSMGVAALASLVTQGPTRPWGDLATTWAFWRNDAKALLEIGDVLLLLAAFVFLAVWRRGALAVGAREPASAEPWASRAAPIALLLAVFFVFYALAPLLGQPVTLLPRYYVQVVPIAVVALFMLIEATLGKRVMVAAMVGVAVLSLINAGGRFYGDQGQPFIVVERSTAYADLLRLQKEAMAEIEKASQQRPVVLSLNEWFKATYPKMGYVEAPIENAIRVDSVELGRALTLGEMPEEFTFVLGDADARGRFAREIWDQAHRQGWQVEVTELTRGGFLLRVVTVRAPAEG